MRLIRGSSLLLVALALMISTAAPEQPSWEEEADKLFMVRHHWWNPVFSEQFNGLWAFDPGDASYRRLRPLSLTIVSDGTIPAIYTGFGTSLAGTGSQLVVQMWPHFIDIEVPSWRLLRRYPPAADLKPVGWAIQGPILSEEAGNRVGLEPGTYGFAHCVLADITNVWEAPPRDCEPHQFPGWDDPLSYGDTSSLLHRSLYPSLGELTFVARVDAYDYESGFPRVPPVLSFDAMREGFWRARAQSIDFLPVIGGAVGPAVVTNELDFPPFDTEGGEFLVFHFHPESRRFFGTAWDNERGEAFFFALNEDFSLFESYEMPHDLIGWPISITSLEAPASTYEQMIPAISHTGGRNGTFWTTDVWIFNPSDGPVSVSIRRVERPEVVKTVSLPAHGSTKIPDVLRWIGGGPDGDGVENDALVLTSPARWGEQLVATSRTSTPDPAGGSYGVAAPAVPGRVGYSNHLPHDRDGTILYNVSLPSLRAANLTLDRRTPGQFRHNIGIVNDNDTPVTIKLLWGFMDPDERELADHRPPEALKRVSVAPHSTKIINLEQRFPAEVRDGWPPRIAVFGDRPVTVWLSMVDNITGDGTFVPFTNFHYRTDSEDDRSVLPAVAHLPGKEGTFWRTDLYGFQGNVYSAFPTDTYTYDRPIAFLHPEKRASQCGGAAAGGEISAHLDGSIGMPLDDWIDTMTQGGFAPSSERYAKRGWRMVFPDVVHLFGGCEGETDIKGGLEISTASWTSGYSRTYTTREDGGTFGGMLPLYPPNGWPVQHFAGIEVSDDFRVNVGFFNGKHDHAVTHRLTLYKEDGFAVATAEFALGHLKSKLEPLEELFGLVEGSLEEGTYGLTVLPLDDDENDVEGRSWAYVTLVDNITGDSTILW